MGIEHALRTAHGRDHPLARFGSSNVGRAKSIYRMGLGHRYGRRMQTISGIHYNWSMPGIASDEYFGLIRNFRRQAFLLLYLFGASPALCDCFVQGRQHGLQRLGPDSLYLPHATSLRMGRLGYQSDAQATLALSYNGLDGYADSPARSTDAALSRLRGAGRAQPRRRLQPAGHQPAADRERVLRHHPPQAHRAPRRTPPCTRCATAAWNTWRCGSWTSILSPPWASRRRPCGCWTCSCCTACCRTARPTPPPRSPPLKRNQHLTAERGREPGLCLERAGRSVPLVEWGAEILAECAPIAAALDAAQGTDAHAQVLQAARNLLREPDATPSARVLARMAGGHGQSFLGFTLAQSRASRDTLLQQPWAGEQQARYERVAAGSLAEQKAIEAADTLDFESWRKRYMAIGAASSLADAPLAQTV